LAKGCYGLRPISRKLTGQTIFLLINENDKSFALFQNKEELLVTTFVLEGENKLIKQPEEVGDHHDYNFSTSWTDRN
jgi:hypothetical protein